ncbi:MULTISPECIES: class F sortase [Bacillales]|nr:sortase [Bacillus sp. FJAT-27238]
MKKLLGSLLFISLVTIGCGHTTQQPVEAPKIESTMQKPAGPIYIKQTVSVYGPSLPPQPTFLPAPPLPDGIMPTLLHIPKLNLQARVEPVGVLPNGQMDVPKAFDRVGILSPWTKPGMKGNAVIAGHFDHYTGPAVFYHLKKLKPGDKIIVREAKGKTLTFQVRRVESFQTAEAPIDQIFGNAEHSHLNLITCSGKFNKKTQEHARRLVVFSELVQDTKLQDEKPSVRK